MLTCVCFEAQTGKHLLSLNLTAFDPERTFLELRLYDVKARKAEPIFDDLDARNPICENAA
jgi:hypothetical protein